MTLCKADVIMLCSRSSAVVCGEPKGNLLYAKDLGRLHYALSVELAGAVLDPRTFPTIPDRVLTLILTITSRRKAFTVLGLIFIRSAISLLVNPSIRSWIVSCSRGVSPNRSCASDRAVLLEALLSKRSTCAGEEDPFVSRTNDRHK